MAAKNIVFLIVCSIALEVALSHPSKRQISKDETDDRICGQSTPCGWAVYNESTRAVYYFMKNNCKCTTDMQCVRQEDDISISAYVYRCETKS